MNSVEPSAALRLHPGHPGKDGIIIVIFQLHRCSQFYPEGNAGQDKTVHRPVIDPATPRSAPIRALLPTRTTSDFDLADLGRVHDVQN